MFCTKESFRIFPIYTEMFKTDKRIIANLSQEGLAEKYIVFTTSLSAHLSPEKMAKEKERTKKKIATRSSKKRMGNASTNYIYPYGE